MAEAEKKATGKNASGWAVMDRAWENIQKKVLLEDMIHLLIVIKRHLQNGSILTWPKEEKKSKR